MELLRNDYSFQSFISTYTRSLYRKKKLFTLIERPNHKDTNVGFVKGAGTLKVSEGKCRMRRLGPVMVISLPHLPLSPSIPQ